ncbi:MAG: hypothetical protein ACHQQQ_05235 [Bacteroidota bacterium]
MKFASILLILILIVSVTGSAQLKSQVDEQQNAASSMLRPLSASNFLGLLDMNRFSMRQNVSMGYFTGGGSGLSLASYTNSMNYQISDPLNIRMDFTLQGSPFGNYGSNLQSNLNKLYISNAELNYRLNNNMFFQFRYQQLPYSQWLMSDPFGYYRSPYFPGDH